VAIALGVPAWAGAPALAQDEPRFIRIGHFPGGSPNSWVHGISADGTVLVGEAPRFGFADFEAFRWTEATGIVGLGDLGGGVSKARAVSLFGEVVVGQSQNLQFKPEAFRWSEAEGMLGLGDLPGGEFNSIGHCVSQNGRVMGGTGYSQGFEAFRWTSDTGMVGLGDLPGGDFFSAITGISLDGEVLVGGSNAGTGLESFLWTSQSGMMVLPHSDDWWRMAPADLSEDGRVVVGWGASDNGPEAFRWSPSRGFEGLGDLPGGRFQSNANATNFDGSVVVGDSITERGSEPFIWTRRHGIRNLQDIIVNDLGLDIGDFELWTAETVSADGRWIAGAGLVIQGDGTDAYLVYLGPDCPADYDGDLDADSDDFFLFLDLFLAGDRRADIDDDADNDSDDFFAFLEDFTTPCP